MKIVNTKNIGNPKIRLCVYGLSGIGKTKLCSTLKDKPIVLSFEGGTLSLIDDAIDVIDCTVDENGNQLSEEFRIKKLFDALKFLQTQEAKDTYKVIFLDSLTEVGDSLLKVLEPKYSGSKNKFEIWAEFGKKMENIVRALRDLTHYDVVMTMLEKDVVDDDGNKLYVRPELSGQKAGLKLVAALDELFRYTFIGGKRALQCSAAPGIIAKDRSGKLNPVEEPDLQMIFNKIKGGKVK
jgi:hypothetical protein